MLVKISSMNLTLSNGDFCVCSNTGSFLSVSHNVGSL